jgi:hypothetical protein
MVIREAPDDYLCVARITTSTKDNRMIFDHDDSYLTGPMLNKRFNISAMTRWRWQRNPSLAFPSPMKVNNRSYWKISALDLWEGNRPSKPIAISTSTSQIQQEAF